MSLILGIDPGSSKLGWAQFCPEENRFLRADVHCFTGPLNVRLDQLETFLPRIMDGVSLVAAEKMFSKPGTGSDRALHAVASIISRAAARASIRYIEIPCSSARKLVLGDGGADKSDVLIYMAMRFGLSPEDFKTTDVSDAALIAVASLSYEPKARKSKRHSEKSLRKQLEIDWKGR